MEDDFSGDAVALVMIGFCLFVLGVLVGWWLW